MPGICSYGVYVPAYRLKREEIAAQTGARSLGGEKAVANYDEDSLTLAAAAALDAVEGLESKTIKGLYFASTTSPFREKQAAAVLAAALDLGRRIQSADFTSSLRAGTSALLAAAQQAAGGRFLVAAGETRLGEPETEQEQLFGDAGAALVMGSEDVIAELEASYTLSEDFTDYWRSEGDRFVKAGDARFIETYGFSRLVREAVGGLLKEQGLQPGDISKLVLCSPDGRQHQGVAKKLGFDPEKQLQETYFKNIGNTGSAMPLFLLGAALEEAGPGDRLLVVGYGDGCDALLFQVTTAIERLRGRRGVRENLAYRRELQTYEKYLRFKNITAETSYEPFSSLAMLWREEKQNTRLYGNRCKNCGSVFFPQKRVCDRCGQKDNLEPFKLSRRGTVFTFTKDHVYLSPDPPLGIAAVDLEGGGRFLGQVTDADPSEIIIGLPVELSFRKMHDGLGVPHYFWKSRPRKEG